ncbi:MAG: sulfatase [Gammaproteobacteria bacterium]|nr:sulfatase [Gammaproteobacteria bacterium]
MSKRPRSLTACMLGIAIAAVTAAGPGAVHGQSVWVDDAQPGSVAPLAGSRPNVIVIMTDDMDTGLFETALGAGLLPAIESRIVAGAVRFDDSFVSNPICCPSRATLLTGQYSHNHRTFTNVALNGAAFSFDDTSTVATWLQASGYRTAHVGKYLNGYGALHELVDYPWLQAMARASWRREDSVGAARLEPTYVPPGWSDWYGLIDASTYCTHNYHINENGIIRQYRRDGGIDRFDYVNGRGTRVRVHPPANDGQRHYYQTDLLALRAAQFIAQASGSDAAPFFLALLPLAPHVETCFQHDTAADAPPTSFDTYAQQFEHYIRVAPRDEPFLEPMRRLAAGLVPGVPSPILSKPAFNVLDPGKPPELLAKLSPLDQAADIPALVNQYAHRAVSLMAVDRMVEAVFAALETSGELDDSVVILTADNGWFHGEHRLSSKMLAYEESARVPLYVRLPGERAADVRNELVVNNDLAPTIAALAGAPPTHTVDGRSLVPLLEGNAAGPWRQRVLIEHYLGAWPLADTRFIETSNLFGVRTSRDGELGRRVYIEYFPGVQKDDGVYFFAAQTMPSYANVWQGDLLHRELYDMSTDPAQLDNLLHDQGGSPPTPARLEEAARMADWLAELRTCAGEACREIEDR